jgi:glycyl-tRNA synthetase
MNKYTITTAVGMVALGYLKGFSTKGKIKKTGSPNYNVNGLQFWDEKEIEAREKFVSKSVAVVKKTMPGIPVIRTEAPILTPDEKIYSGYDRSKMFSTSDNLALRPQTTMGSYSVALELLKKGQKPPFVVWQHGKSFRREQKKTKKHMRLKEFYQLEFQIIYDPEEKPTGLEKLVKEIKNEIQKFVGRCRLVDARPPHYAKWTKDVELSKTNMELASISERNDFPGNNNGNDLKVLEIAIGTDRVVFNHFERGKK